MTVIYIQIGSEPPATEMALADYLIGNDAGGDTHIFTKTQILTGALGEAQGIYGNDAASKIEISDAGTSIVIAPAAGGTVAISGGLKLPLKAGVPNDGDFTTPVDGLAVFNTSDGKLYVRQGGSWTASTAYT